MNDMKNTHYPRRKYEPKPVSLMRGFWIACAFSAFWGILIGMGLTALRS